MSGVLSSRRPLNRCVLSERVRQRDNGLEENRMARKDSLLRLHQRLVARRNALREALVGDLGHLKDLSRPTIGGDTADAAVDTAYEEVSSQLAEQESRELYQIERALQRMQDSSYGVCEHCGSKIAMARLSALPYVTTCINCQREQERYGENGFGGSQGGESWQKLYDTELADHEPTVNLSDIEMDLSESGR